MNKMRRFMIALTLILGVLGTPGSSHAKSSQSKHTAKTATSKIDPNITFITQAYKYMNSGFLAFDVNKFFAYTTPDYKKLFRGRAYTRDAETKGLFAQFQKVAASNGSATRTVTIISIQFYGKQAVVYQKADMSFLIPSQNSNSAVAGGMQGGNFKDIWVRTNDGWALKISEQSP